MSERIYEPPKRQYNIYFDGQRIWSSDEWPPAGLIDATSRACRIANTQSVRSDDHRWSFRNHNNEELSY